MNICNISFNGTHKPCNKTCHKAAERGELNEKPTPQHTHKTNPVKGYILGIALAAGLTASAPCQTCAQVNKKTDSVEIQTINPREIDGNDGRFSLEDLTMCPFVPIFDKDNKLGFLKEIEGQKWTPQLADKIVNKCLNAYNSAGSDFSLKDDGAEFHMTELAQFAPYIKPETRNKLLNVIKLNPKSIVSDEYDPKVMRIFYNSLNPGQKQIFTSLILSEDYAVCSDCNYRYMTGGANIADLIFEDNLSEKTFKAVKNFIIEMDKPDRIKDTKTQSEALIERLEETKKITHLQAVELFKSIKWE